MLLYIHFDEEMPIYQQIKNQIVMAIANGNLKTGEKLPPIRNLADEIGVNMMTVSKAYQLLKAEGYIITDRRSGATVSHKQNAEKKLDKKGEEMLKMIAAEAILAGMDEQAFLDICGKLYEEVSGT